MPGSAPNSPDFDVPRYSDSDQASFSEQVNAITDAFDAAAAKRGAIVDADLTADAAIDTSKLSDPSAVLQPGMLIHSAAASHAGFLLCDGSSYNEADHPALFAAIGTTYGSTGGAGTFNVPDYRGRTILGAGLTARSLGQKGGEEAHLLTSAESGDPSSAAVRFQASAGPADGGSNSIPTSSATATASVSSLAAVVGQDAVEGHNNMPPLGVANVFIKT